MIDWIIDGGCSDPYYSCCFFNRIKRWPNGELWGRDCHSDHATRWHLYGNMPPTIVIYCNMTVIPSSYSQVHYPCRENQPQKVDVSMFGGHFERARSVQLAVKHMGNIVLIRMTYRLWGLALIHCKSVVENLPLVRVTEREPLFILMTSNTCTCLFSNIRNVL